MSSTAKTILMLPSSIDKDVYRTSPNLGPPWKSFPYISNWANGKQVHRVNCSDSLKQDVDPHTCQQLVPNTHANYWPDGRVQLNQWNAGIQINIQPVRWKRIFKTITMQIWYSNTNTIWKVPAVQNQNVPYRDRAEIAHFTVWSHSGSVYWSGKWLHKNLLVNVSWLLSPAKKIWDQPSAN